MCFVPLCWKWTELKTTVGTDDGTYIHYVASTPGFSYLLSVKSSNSKPPVTAPKVAESAVSEPSLIEEAQAVVPESFYLALGGRSGNLLDHHSLDCSNLEEIPEKRK